MLQLADRLTVPQIFFNERHMGGASDVEQMLSDGRLFPCAYLGVRSGYLLVDGIGIVLILDVW